MSSSERNPKFQTQMVRGAVVAAVLLCTTALAGCSADISRFDMASASYSDSAPRQKAPLPSQPLRAGGPVNEPPPAPPSEPYAYNPAPYSPPVSEPVRQGSLPEPMPRGGVSKPFDAPKPQKHASAPVAPAPAVAPAGGTTVEVQHGDTVYGLSKRHHVAISEILAANNLSSPMIRPGQKLIIPPSTVRRPRGKIDKALAKGPAAPAPQAAIPVAPSPQGPGRGSIASAPVAAPGDWTGAYTVTARDSLSAIAHRYNVKVAELQAANNIADPTKLRAGTVLKVPARTGAADVVPSAPAEPAAAPASTPVIINAQKPERVAVVAPQSPVLNDATPEARPETPAPTRTALPPKPTGSAAAPTRFRWPAKGRVVANFGNRSDNTHNDGINILVPLGTEVAAAETGTVAYAGNELKGYGNLVLIRHEGNWVSAYAHNETLLVKRGDKVDRGQVIAKAGKSGAVDQPQVHFELRQGSKPVDPMPYLEK